MGERLQGAEGRAPDELFRQLQDCTGAAQACGLTELAYEPALRARTGFLHVFLRNDEMVEMARRGLDTRLPFVLRKEQYKESSHLCLGRLDADRRTIVGVVPFPFLVVEQGGDPNVPLSYGIQGQPLTADHINLLRHMHRIQERAGWWPESPPNIHLVAPPGAPLDNYQSPRWRIIKP